MSKSQFPGLVKQSVGKAIMIVFNVSGEDWQVYISKEKFEIGAEVMVDLSLLEKAIQPTKQNKPAPITLGVSLHPKGTTRAEIIKRRSRV